MKKNKSKEKVYFSIDADLYRIFISHIDKNALGKSKLIEKLIEEYMNGLKNNNNGESRN